MQITFETHLGKRILLRRLLLLLLIGAGNLGYVPAVNAQFEAELHASVAGNTVLTTSQFVDIVSRRLRSRSAGDVGIYGAGAPAGVPFVQSSGPMGMPLLSNAFGDDFVVRAQGVAAPGFGPAFGGTPACGTCPPQYQGSGWFSGYGLAGDVEGDTNSTGYDYDSRGVVFGIDRNLLPNLLVGIVGGYTGTDLDAGASTGRADVDSYHVGLYGHLTEGLFYSSGLIAYGYHQFETQRLISLMGPVLPSLAEYGGHEFTTYVEKGLNLNWHGWRVQPLIGLQYLSLNRESFRETGAGPLVFNVSKDHVESLRVSLGGRIAPEPPPGIVGAITPEIRGRWVHEFLDEQQGSLTAVGGTFFPASSPNLGRNFGIVGAGVNIQLSPLATLFLDYDFQFNSQLESHAGTGGLEFLW